MGTILSKEEKCEISRQFADDTVYIFVSNLVTVITYLHPAFPLSTEEVYCSVIDGIDTIRDIEGTRDCENFVDSLYKQLCVSMQKTERGRMDNADLHRATALIVYSISTLLTITHLPCPLKYAMKLQMSIDDPDYTVSRMMSDITQTAIKDIFNRQSIDAWRDYYLSDTWRSIQIEETLCKLRQFDYISFRGLKEYGLIQYEQFVSDFQHAAEADADTLVKFLLRYRSLAILDFHHDSLKQIFENIQRRFPTMKKYGYPNFAKYANKEGLSRKLHT